jgi:hypothetical protein
VPLRLIVNFFDAACYLQARFHTVTIHTMSVQLCCPTETKLERHGHAFNQLCNLLNNQGGSSCVCCVQKACMAARGQELVLHFSFPHLKLEKVTQTAATTKAPHT